MQTSSQCLWHGRALSVSHHWLFSALFILACCYPSYCSSTESNRAEAITVSASKISQGTYFVVGRFFINAPRAVIWEVLTDYDAIHEFVSSIRKSRVKEQHQGYLLIEQESKGKFFIFSRNINIVLEVREEPLRKIWMKEVSQKDFDLYEGSWAIEEAESGLNVIYSLKSQPSFWVPGFIVKSSMRKNIRTSLKEIKSEILKRNQATSTLLGNK